MKSQKQNSLRLYQRLYTAQADLSLAKQYATFLLKKGWHSNPWERRGSIYMQQSAFTTALVVSYSRPFTRSNGWPDFPASLLRLSDTQLAMHFSVITLRHQVYAHSDSVRFDIKPVQSFEGAHIDIVAEPFRKLNRNECLEIVEITSKLVTNIGCKLEELRSSVSESF